MLEGDRIVFKSDLIEGWAADVALDTFARATMLHWTRRAEPGTYLCEMIHLCDCGDFRARVWQWFHAGRLSQRTLIDEQRVSHDWRQIKGPSFAGEALAG